MFVEKRLKSSRMLAETGFASLACAPAAIGNARHIMAIQTVFFIRHLLSMLVFPLKDTLDHTVRQVSRGFANADHSATEHRPVSRPWESDTKCEPAGQLSYRGGFVREEQTERVLLASKFVCPGGSWRISVHN